MRNYDDLKISIVNAKAYTHDILNNLKILDSMFSSEILEIPVSQQESMIDDIESYLEILKATCNQNRKDIINKFQEFHGNNDEINKDIIEVVIYEPTTLDNLENFFVVCSNTNDLAKALSYAEAFLKQINQETNIRHARLYNQEGLRIDVMLDRESNFHIIALEEPKKEDEANNIKENEMNVKKDDFKEANTKK